MAFVMSFGGPDAAQQTYQPPAGVLILSGFGLLKLREDDDDLVEVG